jgi:hypothetical protein
VCTAWWHVGRWYARHDVALDLGRIDTLPGVLLDLVSAAKARLSSMDRLQWWWAGDGLAPWAARCQADPPSEFGGWVCQPAPMPFGPEIEAIGQGPAYRWALALGLALHPGWRE